MYKGFWSVDATVYYGFDGYSKFPSANDNLSKANESISFEFKFCQTDGILLYATDEERVLYFAIGVYQSRILLEFDLGDGLREVSEKIYLALLLAVDISLYL